MKQNEDQVVLVPRELKCGDLVQYRFYESQPYIENAIFIRSFYESRGIGRIGEEDFDEQVEMHEVYLFDSATCETVFAFELEEVLNE